MELIPVQGNKSHLLKEYQCKSSYIFFKEFTKNYHFSKKRLIYQQKTSYLVWGHLDGRLDRRKRNCLAIRL